MQAKITAAMASGTQPPSRNFSMLEESRAKSSAMKDPNTRMLSGQPQFHLRTAITKTSVLVISIVPVTAMP